ncbi:hypothetical protein WJX72_003901 [[Myrmecia] bisecta]|uniref:Uncharacterized protein n=1 Tax=[Myrmecia] bisecta TaxID=41462 RepID=A0AAW1R6E8_9CHLO
MQRTTFLLVRAKMALAHLARSYVRGSSHAFDSLMQASKACTSSGSLNGPQARGFADRRNVEAQLDHDLEHEKDSSKGTANFFGAGIKATAYSLKQKAEQLVGKDKPISNSETQEPAGSMENKDPNRPVTEAYRDMAGKAKEQQGGDSVNDRYQSAAAIARSTCSAGKDDPNPSAGDKRPGSQS